MGFGANVLEIIDNAFTLLGIDVSPLIKQIIASVGIFVDLKERLDMEHKLREMQEKLLQSEKLEQTLLQVLQAATKKGQELSDGLQIDLED